MIHQKDISTKVWEAARRKAEMDYPNPNSKGHRRIKFANAPYALIAYVGKREDIKEARMKMYTSLGTSKGEKWSTLEDGSKMRFVPMFVGEIESDEVYEKITDAMRM